MAASAGDGPPAGAGDRLRAAWRVSWRAARRVSWRASWRAARRSGAFPAPGTVAAWVARVHPQRWLRLLRAATLALIVVTGLLCLLVRYQAHREITTIGDGAQAVSEFSSAQQAVRTAISALRSVSPDAAALTGPPRQYVDSVATAAKQITLATLHNVAGRPATNQALFAGGLLVSFDDQARRAIVDFGAGNNKLARAELGYPADVGVQGSLLSLLRTEQKATAADLGSPWLRPGDVWVLLLAPSFALLIVTASASYVLWHGFRRLLSGRLILANAVTLALAAMAAVLNGSDATTARAHVARYLGKGVTALSLPSDGPGPLGFGLAFSPQALAAGLALTAIACALAYAAYWPRLEEYRYRG